MLCQQLDSTREPWNLLIVSEILHNRDNKLIIEIFAGTQSEEHLVIPTGRQITLMIYFIYKAKKTSATSLQHGAGSELFQLMKPIFQMFFLAPISYFIGLKLQNKSNYTPTQLLFNFLSFQVSRQRIQTSSSF